MSESSGGELAQPGAGESTPIKTLIGLFESCQSESEFAEVSKFYEAPDLQSPSQKEELVERAILFSSLEMKSRLQKWWDCALHQVRDFWKFLEQQQLLVEASG